MQRRSIGSLLMLVLGLCAWSPWINASTASRFAEIQFNHAWEGIIDGCGTAWNELGAKEFHKIPFGATVKLTYLCGLVAPDEPPMETTVYVSFLGIAFGYPAP